MFAYLKVRKNGTFFFERSSFIPETSRTGLWARCSRSLLKFEKYVTSLLAETKRRVIPATKFKFFTSTWQFYCNITRERAVGNPSAKEGQTANILTSRTGLWARCSTSLLKFEKYQMSLLTETKHRVIPATKFKILHKYLTILFMTSQVV